MCPKLGKNAFSYSCLQAEVSGDETIGWVSVPCVEVSAENDEVVPTVIINQFGHLVHLALPTTAIGLCGQQGIKVAHIIHSPTNAAMFQHSQY